MKKYIHLCSFVLCTFIAVIAYFFIFDRLRWFWIAGGTLFGVIFFAFFLQSNSEKKKTAPKFLPSNGQISELILLSEENTHLARWSLYGKSGLVIGRDVGENEVSVNLENAAYSSMIEVEHAVLNYAGNDWFIEDLSSKNGVSVRKSDGKKYKLASGKPCKLEKGDIIFIGMTRLQIV